MIELIKRAFAEQEAKKLKLATKAAPATAATTAKVVVPDRSWSQRDYPVPASQRKPKTEARTSIHSRIVSRTGSK